LIEGRYCIIEIPKTHWDDECYCCDDLNTLMPVKVYTKHGAFLDHLIDSLCPIFLNQSKRGYYDGPQQRLLLAVNL